MKLHELKPNEGSVQTRKRVGRGPGSGLGKTSGKGHKARSGGGVRPGFEGGQLPLFRRLPKRGFNNYEFRTEYAIVNVGDLNDFKDGSVIELSNLKESGLVKKEKDGIKILGNGELTKKLTVKANKFSSTARVKIENAGGKIEVI